MSDFVLDSSVTLALFLPASVEQRSYAILVHRMIRAGAVPAVPALWAQEVGSVLVKCRRRRVITETVLRSALQDLDQVVCEVFDMPYTVGDVAAIATRYLLQGYDAVFFDLAKRLELPIASIDRGHASACKAQGVKLLTF